MPNEKNICGECGTENETEYRYCKNCGAWLSVREVAGSGEFVPPTVPGGYPAAPGVLYPEWIDGVPSGDLSAYIGKKTPQYLPDFMKLSFTRKKTSWCWPAAILGFLFGSFGSGLWFLYRKMYKIGAAFAAVGILLMLINTALSYEFLQLINAGASIDELMASAAFGPYFLAILIGWAASIAACVVSGIYAKYWYMRKAVRDITAYRRSNVDPRYYPLGLMAIGGTSGGALAIGMIVWFLLSALVQAATL